MWPQRQSSSRVPARLARCPGAVTAVANWSASPCDGSVTSRNDAWRRGGRTASMTDRSPASGASGRGRVAAPAGPSGDHRRKLVRPRAGRGGSQPDRPPPSTGLRGARTRVSRGASAAPVGLCQALSGSCLLSPAGLESSARATLVPSGGQDRRLIWRVARTGRGSALSCVCRRAR